jgi:phosphocarrier protein HPr
MDNTEPIAPEAERANGEAVVRDPTGLHARPAVKFTRLAKQFEATVRVRAGANGEWVNAKSPNRVMKLKARHGETIWFEAEGAGAAEAVSALVALVERNFGD